MASAEFTVNAASVSGAMAVSASTTVNLALASTTGVNSVAWSIVGNHSTSATDPTITPAGSPSGVTASFPMPAGAGQAYLVKCVINGGRDASGNIVSEWTFLAVVGVVGGNGVVPFSSGEELERSNTHGWTEDLNIATGSAPATDIDAPAHQYVLRTGGDAGSAVVASRDTSGDGDDVVYEVTAWCTLRESGGGGWLVHKKARTFERVGGTLGAGTAERTLENAANDTDGAGLTISHDTDDIEIKIIFDTIDDYDGMFGYTIIRKAVVA